MVCCISRRRLKGNNSFGKILEIFQLNISIALEEYAGCMASIITIPYSKLLETHSNQSILICYAKFIHCIMHGTMDCL